jgi:hypothetical protein
MTRGSALAMSDTTESNDERPCLHCLIGEVIGDFYAEYGSLSGEQEFALIGRAAVEIRERLVGVNEA